MKEISFEDFYDLYQSQKLALIDVRETEEFEAAHLEGAQSFPLSRLADSYQDLDPQASYYVICKSGVRSARACQFLEGQGYDVIHVQAGMDQLES